jgi:hypothetical protein
MDFFAWYYVQNLYLTTMIEGIIVIMNYNITIIGTHAINLHVVASRFNKQNNYYYYYY